MARLRSRVEQAAVLHRHAAAVAAVAGPAIDRYSSTSAPADQYAEQHDLAARLRAAASELAPGWLGAPLDALSSTTPLGGTDAPTQVRVGLAHPLDDASFPIVVPLLGAGHLAIDADARDPRVGGLLRSLVLRLLATVPVGSLQVRVVDTAGGGNTFTLFHGIDAVLPSPATDRTGLRAVLAEAEQRLRQPNRDATTMLVVIASLPELTEGSDLARISSLAHAGPQAGLHLVVAGWPPPPLTAETTHAPLPHSTQITLRNPYAWVGDPPGATFRGDPPGATFRGDPPGATFRGDPPSGPRAPGAGGPQSGGRPLPGRLNAPAYLDPDPPAELVRRVCDQLAAQLADRSQLGVADLVDADLWRERAVHGLSTVVGRAAGAPVELRFDDATPHWMVGGRSGSGKTAFLLNVLYGLSTRYGPDELALYLLDFKEGVSFSEFVPNHRDPSWLPHARAVGIESDREYGAAVLRELESEMVRRSVEYKQAGVTRYVDLRAAVSADREAGLPRVVCVIDEFQVLLAGNDSVARESARLVEAIARTGRSYGVHLVLCSQTVRGVEALYGKRDPIFGQFPVRIALSGGDDVLDPLRTGDATAGLPLGDAIVNTRAGATGFDEIVRFPDPYAEPDAVGELRHRMWAARAPGSPAPSVFAGNAVAQLADDPTYRSFLTRTADPDATPLPAGRPPRVLLGRLIDVAGSTASFPLDAAPGRAVAILGPDPVGAGIAAAAALSLAAQHSPGTARFLLAPPVGDAAAAAADLAATLTAAGHPVRAFEPAEVAEIARVTDFSGYTYVLALGADGLDVRTLLRDGPSRRIHVVGWWRGLRRFLDDTGGSVAREEVACLVVTNLAGPDVSLLLGQPVEWRPRADRALLHDRHTGVTTAIVPFVHTGRSG